MACPDRSFSKIAKPVSRRHTGTRTVLSKGHGALDRGAMDVTEITRKIRSVSLPPHQLRELGLKECWQKCLAGVY